MEAEIIKLALSHGLFAVLFVALLFYVLRYNEKREERQIVREEKLIACLEKLTAQYEGIIHDVGEIKTDIEGLREKVGA